MSGKPTSTSSELFKTSQSAALKKDLFSLRDQSFFLLLAETFQALGDSSRVQIIWALAKAPSNVGDLAQLLEMSQPAISHHLRTLRNLRLVKAEKAGRESFYSLDDEHINCLLEEGIRHVKDLLS